MDFDYDTEQNDLRDAVRALLERAYGEIEQRRKVTANDPGFDEKLWARLAEMGLLGLPFAEEHGGTGAGPVEVAIVAEEIGRVLAPEPFVEVVVLAGGLVDGETTARVALAGLDVEECLRRADAGTALAAAEDLVHTGPTGTNVGDIVIGLKLSQRESGVLSSRHGESGPQVL